MHFKTCPCGSEKAREELYDARGIFAGFVCEDCEQEKRSKFRREIFTNPAYDCDEPVEPDDSCCGIWDGPCEDY